jgi:hypothetical protein
MITKRIVNKIGLECEVLIRNNKDELVIPNDYGLAHDDFPILGEVRSLPYETVQDTVFEFWKDYYAYNLHTKYNKLFLDIQDGWDVISPEYYSKILKKMGNKEISQAKNIYKTDILKLTDAIVEDGKITGHKISCGLHIHFSSDIVIDNDYSIPDFVQDTQNHYIKLPTTTRYHEETKLYSLLTDNVIKSIIRGLDNDILYKYTIPNQKLKYRYPGFYELKSYGFEYRSLPFNQLVLDNLVSIVEYCFDKLNKLSKLLV